MAKISVVTLVSLCLVGLSHGLENGVARTPPMGWMTWQRFRCIVDCKKHPNDCISEKLIKEIAERMVQDGYLSAGYEYLVIDDCWLSHERDAQGNLQEDPERFPSGMKNLSDYVHSLGLKFGIYEDYGTKTCAGYPGIIGNLKRDAELFASWDVDYIKIDGCYADTHDMDQGYPEFGKYLLETNRTIVYSCSWPFYQSYEGISPNFTLIAQHCNLWRNYDDIQDDWNSVKDIMNYFATQQEDIAQFSGPGHWNDPDMLIIGNYGLSVPQAKSQMAVWTVLAAPLLMSHDLRSVSEQYVNILLNKEAIKINQDPAGVAGRRVYTKKNIDIWIKPIEFKKDGSNKAWAVAVVSKRTDGSAYDIKVSLKYLKLDLTKSYKFTEVYNDLPPFVVKSGDDLLLSILPSNSFLFRVTVVNNQSEENSL